MKKIFDKPGDIGAITTSFGLKDAETLNLQLSFFCAECQLISESSSCSKANESKHSSDDEVKQLESSELEEGDAGLSRSSSSKKSPLEI